MSGKRSGKFREIVMKRLPEGKVEVQVDGVRIVVGHVKEWGNSGHVVGHA